LFFDAENTGEEKQSLLCRLLDEDGYSAQLSNKELMSLAQYLIENGASVNQVEEGSDSPLIQAVRLASYDLVNFLLTHGANVNHPGKNSRTALHECFGGNLFIFHQSFNKIQHENGSITTINPINNWANMYPWKHQICAYKYGVSISGLQFIFVLKLCMV
jgi:ankyrin repeat protein